ncbi:hypothetical protein PFISCL1PPCAC_27824, partial [Pristionchus fissidentatus]
MANHGSPLVRNDFEQIKSELRKSMLICREYHLDGFYNVMFSISSVLYQAVASIEETKKVNCTASLPQAYHNLDRVGIPVNNKERGVFFTFARSFTLFMDMINGLNTGAINVHHHTKYKTQSCVNPSPSYLQSTVGVQTLSRPTRPPTGYKRARLCPQQPVRATSSLIQNSVPYADVVPKTEPVENSSELDEIMNDIVKEEKDIKEEMKETLQVWNEIEDRLTAAQCPVDDLPGSSREEIKMEEDEKEKEEEHIVPVARARKRVIPAVQSARGDHLYSYPKVTTSNYRHVITAIHPGAQGELT